MSYGFFPRNSWRDKNPLNGNRHFFFNYRVEDLGQVWYCGYIVYIVSHCARWTSESHNCIPTVCDSGVYNKTKVTGKIRLHRGIFFVNMLTKILFVAHVIAGFFSLPIAKKTLSGFQSLYIYISVALLKSGSRLS